MSEPHGAIEHNSFPVTYMVERWAMQLTNVIWSELNLGAESCIESEDTPDKSIRSELKWATFKIWDKLAQSDRGHGAETDTISGVGNLFVSILLWAEH
jgi:hypothetical protein